MPCHLRALSPKCQFRAPAAPNGRFALLQAHSTISEPLKNAFKRMHERCGHFLVLFLCFKHHLGRSWRPRFCPFWALPWPLPLLQGFDSNNSWLGVGCKPSGEPTGTMLLHCLCMAALQGPLKRSPSFCPLQGGAAPPGPTAAPRHYLFPAEYFSILSYSLSNAPSM